MGLRLLPLAFPDDKPNRCGPSGQAGEDARHNGPEPTLQPVARVRIGDPDNEDAVLARHQAGIPQPGLKGRARQFQLKFT
jgi:hypothetical protein